LHVSTVEDTLQSQVATPAKTARRILIVDDEPSVSDSISRILAMDQYEAEIVTSGQEALEAVQRGKFDLIIVDYEMPAMKGDKLAAAIKALAPQQPIIMITAYGEDLRFAGNFPLAVDLVISKPFALQEFREAVRHLASKTGGAGPPAPH
jgi:two-component system, cell cycle response regulator CpdR